MGPNPSTSSPGSTTGALPLTQNEPGRSISSNTWRSSSRTVGFMVAPWLVGRAARGVCLPPLPAGVGVLLGRLAVLLQDARQLAALAGRVDALQLDVEPPVVAEVVVE